MCTVYYRDDEVRDFVTNYKDFINDEVKSIILYAKYILKPFEVEGFIDPAIYISSEMPIIERQLSEYRWNEEAIYELEEFADPDHPDLRKLAYEQNWKELKRYTPSDPERAAQYKRVLGEIRQKEKITSPCLGDYSYQKHLISLYPKNFLIDKNEIQGVPKDPRALGFLYTRKQSPEEVEAILSKVLAHEIFHAFQYYLHPQKCSNYKFPKRVTETEIMMESTADFFSFLWLTEKPGNLEEIRERNAMWDSWQKYSEKDWPYNGAKYFVRDADARMIDDVDRLNDWDKFISKATFLTAVGIYFAPEDFLHYDGPSKGFRRMLDHFSVIYRDGFFYDIKDEAEYLHRANNRRAMIVPNELMSLLDEFRHSF